MASTSTGYVAVSNDLRDAICNYLSQHSILKSMLETDAQKDEFLGCFLAKVDVWEQMVVYEGFNALHILAKAKINYENWKAGVEADPGVAHTIEFVYKSGNQEESRTFDLTSSFSEVLALLIFIFVNRGCTWDKITQKISGAARDFLEMAKTIFNLDTEVHAGGTALKPDTITVPRLAQCVPYYSLEYYHMGKAKLFFSTSQLHINPANIDKVILCPLFNTIIPGNKKGWKKEANPHHVAFLSHALMDRIINRKKPAYTDMAQLYGYYEASFRTPVLDEGARKMLRQKFGVAGDKGEGLCTAYLNASQACHDTLRIMYAEDPQLDNVMAKLGELKD